MTAMPQHMQALASAEAQKLAKGDFNRTVSVLPPAAGARKVADAVEHDYQDQAIGRLRIRRMLAVIKRMGNQNVDRCLRAAGVMNGDRRLNELTPRQRGAIVIQLELWADRWNS